MSPTITGEHCCSHQGGVGKGNPPHKRTPLAGGGTSYPRRMRRCARLAWAQQGPPPHHWCIQVVRPPCAGPLITDGCASDGCVGRGRGQETAAPGMICCWPPL